MAITLVAAGTYQLPVGSTVTPVAGGAYQAGDCLIIHVGESAGSGTLSTPSGWTLLTQGTNNQNHVFGKIAASSSETIPGLTYSSGGSFANGVLHIFRGVDSSLVDAGFTPTDRAGNNTTSVIGTTTAKTPTVDGALIILAGGHNKTSTSNGATVSAPAGFPMLGSLVPNGTQRTNGSCYQIQTTATTVSGSQTMPISIAESSASNMQSTILSLAPALDIILHTRSLLGVGV